VAWVPQPSPRPRFLMETRRVHECAAFFCLWSVGLARGADLEFALRRRLFGADASWDNFGAAVVFCPDGASGDSAKNIDLADVSVSVGDCAAKKARDRHGDRGTGREIFVELIECGKESRGARFPVDGGRIMPSFFPLRLRQRPIEQIAEVSENLSGRARFRAGFESSEIRRDAANGFRAAVRD
jgi:hypothetical protein